MALADLLAMSQGSPVPIHNDAVQIAAQAEEQRRRRDQQQQNQQLAMAMMGQLREQNRMAMLRQQHEQEMRDAAYNQRMRPLSKGFEIAQATGPQGTAEFLRSNRGALQSIGVPVGDIGMTKEEQAAAQFFRPEEWEQIKSRYRTYDAARPVITGRASEALSAAQKRNRAIADPWQRHQDWETWLASPVGRAVETIIGPQPDMFKTVEAKEKYADADAKRETANYFRQQQLMSLAERQRQILAEKKADRERKEEEARARLEESRRQKREQEERLRKQLEYQNQWQRMPGRGNILGVQGGQPQYRGELEQGKRHDLAGWRRTQEAIQREAEQGRNKRATQYVMSIEKRAELDKIQNDINAQQAIIRAAQGRRARHRTLPRVRGREDAILAENELIGEAAMEIKRLNKLKEQVLRGASPTPSRTAAPTQAAPRPVTPRPTPITPRAGWDAANRASDQLAGKRNKYLQP